MISSLQVNKKYLLEQKSHLDQRFNPSSFHADITPICWRGSSSHAEGSSEASFSPFSVDLAQGMADVVCGQSSTENVNFYEENDAENTPSASASESDSQYESQEGIRLTLSIDPLTARTVVQVCEWQWFMEWWRLRFSICRWSHRKSRRRNDERGPRRRKRCVFIGVRGGFSHVFWG